MIGMPAGRIVADTPQGPGEGALAWPVVWRRALDQNGDNDA